MAKKETTMKFTALVNFNVSASTGTYIDEANVLAKRYYEPILGPEYIVYGVNFHFIRDRDCLIDANFVVIEVTLVVEKRL
jgi:hypothetical protein